MAGPQMYLRIQVRGTALATGEARIKKVYNVYDYLRSASGTPPTMATILAAFKSAVLTPLGNCLSVSYVKAYCDLRWLDDPTNPYTIIADGVNGQVAGDSLPSVNNVSMQLKTGLRGRIYRGAKRYGPIAESHTTLDYLNSTAIALWATFQTAYLTPFVAGGYNFSPVVVSQKSSTFNPTTAIVVATPVTTTIVNAYLGIMRKRAQERVSST